MVPSKLLIYIKFREKVNLLVSETQGKTFLVYQFEGVITVISYNIYIYILI